MTDMDIQELASLTTGDPDVENFERLFTKLKEMKGTNSDRCAYKAMKLYKCYKVDFWSNQS